MVSEGEFDGCHIRRYQVKVSGFGVGRPLEGSVLIARSRVLRDCRRAPIDDDDDVVPTDVREFRMEEWTNFDFDRRLLGDFTADDISDGLVLACRPSARQFPLVPFVACEKHASVRRNHDRFDGCRDDVPPR